jgi:hypothetical protein
VAPPGVKISRNTSLETAQEEEDPWAEEFLGEEEEILEEEYEAVPSKSKSVDPVTTNPSVWCMEDTEKQFEIDAFLKFTDVWTMCKAVDSYDNRFAMDLFGNMIVDKGKSYEEKSCNATENIFKELSTSFQVPEKIMSEIMTTASKKKERQGAKGNRSKPKCSSTVSTEECDKRPRTRIFVVKRDLSGYEYLKSSSVNRMIKKAKKLPESIVVADTLPNNRKFLTIMEPIRNCENPHGLWNNKYREPVFRPRYLCNRTLRVARPEELRWFAQILANAHTKRGNHFPSPKDKYLKERQELREKQEEALRLEEEEKAREAELEAQRKLEEAEEGDNEDEEEQESKKKKKDKGSKKGKDKSSKKSKGKKEKSEKKAKGKKSKKDVKDDEAEQSEGKKSKKEKKDKKEKKGKKGKKGKSPTEPTEFETKEEEMEEEEMEEEEELGEIEVLVEVTEEPTRPKGPKLGSQYPGDYPKNVSDVRGLYGQEPMEAVTIKPYDGIPDRKTLVVRSIIELPFIDDKLQDTLLMASQAYSKAMEAQRKEDSVKEEMGEGDGLIEDRFIDENFRNMNLLQQSSGKLLDLVL